MKMLTALMCSLIVAAPLAVAQTPKPPAPAPQPGVLAKPDLKPDARTEACKQQATDKNLRGEARETFMTGCLKN